MTFAAKYDGECTVCERTFRRGEHLVWVDPQTAVHVHCSQDGDLDATEAVLDPTRQSKRPTCPKCWEQVSVTGDCGCTDE